MPKFKVLDLFSGIGGFSLGLERTGGFETVAFCEIEPFPRKVLAKHWPEVPIYEDVRELTADRLRADGIAADVICGGFPCQPFSHAARGRNNAVDFWPEMFRVVSEAAPRYAIAENVEEKPIAAAAADLKSIGYEVTYRNIGASDAGADHQRDRWWLCAYPNDDGQLSRAFHEEASKLPRLCQGLWGAENYARAVRVSDGLPNRLDRLKALGNAVVPQIPELIGGAILEAGNA